MLDWGRLETSKRKEAEKRNEKDRKKTAGRLVLRDVIPRQKEKRGGKKRELVKPQLKKFTSRGRGV